MKSAERLLPGTDALPANTVEVCKYHGRLLVRRRNKNGSMKHEYFADTEQGRDAAHRLVMEEARLLKEDYFK